jgi:cytochrome P450
VEIHHHADVCAVLADPAFVVPPPPPADASTGVAWLRGSVSRFSNGDDHRRRRALVTAALESLDVSTLRQDARERTTAVLRDAGDDPLAVVERLAHTLPVEVLAGALGVAASAADVAEVAAVYHPHCEAGAGADRAVERLVAACGGVANEIAAAHIALLVQACTATAGLIENALFVLMERGGAVEAILARTLREDPPVRSTRRAAPAGARIGSLDVEPGTVVTLDLTADGDERLPFGSGLRPCPGREHALALAAGMLDALQASADRLAHRGGAGVAAEIAGARALPADALQRVE